MKKKNNEDNYCVFFTIEEKEQKKDMHTQIETENIELYARSDQSLIEFFH